MVYNYGIKNRYVPTNLIRNAYGWNGSQARPSEVPTHLMPTPTGMTSEEFRQQFAYEWVQSGESTIGFTNPPFTSGAAGRLNPGIKGSGGPPRIQRGYIRRGEIEIARPESKARLYFMYNPESITRDYVSYLDQTALDPFNTIYQSNNLVAPPSILDFSFSLFFDRQDEAQDDGHPGVFVDYQFFDLVVRNVVPDDPATTGNTLPDNGVMMVNPREICVVFSKQISVQGRPLNARVNFIKFTHRMVPTRMQIDLTIRATYLGPLRAAGIYVAEEFAVANTVQVGGALAEKQYVFDDEIVESTTTDANGNSISTNPVINEAWNNVTQGSADAREKALQFAMNHTIETEQHGNAGPNVTKYSKERRNDKMINGHFDYVDCSSLVVRSYQGIGAMEAMGWNLGTDTKKMMASVDSPRWRKRTWKQSIDADRSGDAANKPMRGDILLRDGHCGFFVAIEGNNMVVFEAQSDSPGTGPQVGTVKYNKLGDAANKWQYVMRPVPTGAYSQVGNTSLTGPS